LSAPDAQPSRALFDVEQFRLRERRYAVAQTLNRPAVVLGSSQSPAIVNEPRARASGTEVVRRRGGGGAVLLRPGDHLWIDAWIPHNDPLWCSDVAEAAAWVGNWWDAALGRFGIGDLTVHRGRAERGRHGGLVCFSGRGPGELLSGDRKVMGVSQWRCREGSLFHTCAYTAWEPGPLVELFDLDPPARQELVSDLVQSAVGLDDLGLVPGIAALRAGLLASFPTWEGDTSLPPV
jgi:lipoate---protein ligase